MNTHGLEDSNSNKGESAGCNFIKVGSKLFAHRHIAT